MLQAPSRGSGGVPFRATATLGIAWPWMTVVALVAPTLIEETFRANCGAPGIRGPTLTIQPNVPDTPAGPSMPISFRISAALTAQPMLSWAQPAMLVPPPAVRRGRWSPHRRVPYS
jgi:hypothetical protein